MIAHLNDDGRRHGYPILFNFIAKQLADNGIFIQVDGLKLGTQTTSTGVPHIRTKKSLDSVYAPSVVPGEKGYPECWNRESFCSYIKKSKARKHNLEVLSEYYLNAIKLISTGGKGNVGTLSQEKREMEKEKHREAEKSRNRGIEI